MSRVAEILMDDGIVYSQKAADYAPDGDPWQNFCTSAAFAAAVCRGLPENDPRRSTAVLIGVKISRLMTLGLTKEAKNEAIKDTMRDLRVYVAILEAQSE